MYRSDNSSSAPSSRSMARDIASGGSPAGKNSRSASIACFFERFCSSGGENNATAGGLGRFNLAERGLSAIQSPRKPNGLSHCIFQCLIVEASSQAQNHLSVLADRYTERCRGVFDCTGDG